jgi:hypothetical protein
MKVLNAFTTVLSHDHSRFAAARLLLSQLKMVVNILQAFIQDLLLQRQFLKCFFSLLQLSIGPHMPK